MSDDRDVGVSADLAAYSVMRALLNARDAAGRSDDRAHRDVARVIDDLEQGLGRDAVFAVIGSLALRALRPIELRAETSGTEPEAELAAEEQRTLAAEHDLDRGGGEDER